MEWPPQLSRQPANHICLSDAKGDPMRVVAISGSARKDGSTAILVSHVFEELNAAGMEPGT